MDLDDLYQQILSSKIGDITKATQEHVPAIYEGELAMALMLQCFRIDGFGKKGTMHTLCALKEVIPGKRPFIPKRSKLNEELKALGLSHFSKWITSCRNDTFVLHIRGIPYEKGKAICRILFGW
jgi:hypothetical protein